LVLSPLFLPFYSLLLKSFSRMLI